MRQPIIGIGFLAAKARLFRILPDIWAVAFGKEIATVDTALLNRQATRASALPTERTPLAFKCTDTKKETGHDARAPPPGE